MSKLPFILPLIVLWGPILLKGQLVGNDDNPWSGGNASWQDPLDWELGILPGTNNSRAVVNSGNPRLQSQENIPRLRVAGGTITLDELLTVEGDGNDTTTDLELAGGSINGANRLVLGNEADGKILNTFAFDTEFINRGQILQSDSANLTSNLSSGGTLINEGTYTIAVNDTHGIESNVTLNNSGELRIQGTGRTDFNGPFLNSGNTIIEEGILQISRNGRSTGNFTFAENTSLNFNNSDFTFDEGGISGPGLIRILNDSLVQSNAFLNFPMLEIQSSELRLTHPEGSTTKSLHIANGHLTVNGGPLEILSHPATTYEFDWQGGSISGEASPAIILRPETAGVISGTTQLNTTLRNEGQIQFTEGATLSSSIDNTGTLLNSGTFRVLSSTNARLEAPLTFINEGLFHKQQESTFFIEGSMVNDGAVIVSDGILEFPGSYLQNEGLLLANGGDVQFSSQPSIEGGVLGGHGKISGDLDLQGNSSFIPGVKIQSDIAGDVMVEDTIPTNAGLLEIAGNLQFSVDNMIMFLLATSDPIELAKVNISGDLNLAGNLQLLGDYSLWQALEPGESLTLFSANSISGNFNNVFQDDSVYVANINGDSPVGRFQLRIDDSSVALAEFEPIPEPETYLMLFMGISVIGIWFYRKRKTA